MKLEWQLLEQLTTAKSADPTKLLLLNRVVNG